MGNYSWMPAAYPNALSSMQDRYLSLFLPLLVIPAIPLRCWCFPVAVPAVVGVITNNQTLATGERTCFKRYPILNLSL